MERLEATMARGWKGEERVRLHGTVCRRQKLSEEIKYKYATSEQRRVVVPSPMAK